MKKCLFLITLVMLTACSRSKDPDLYVLTPMKSFTHQYSQTHLNIGIDDISLPGWLEKNTLMINISPHHLLPQTYDEWAEPLSKNIARVIRTNLSGLLGGALVQNAPFDSRFLPDYQLQIFINQLNMLEKGESILAVEYLIYKDQKILKKKTLHYQNKILPATHENRVIGMNHNLNRLSEDIAQTFRKVAS